MSLRTCVQIEILWEGSLFIKFLLFIVPETAVPDCLQPEPLFQKVAQHQAMFITSPVLSAQSSLDDSLPTRSRSVSPEKSRGKHSLLIGLSTGLFDANNPKASIKIVLQNCTFYNTVS